MGHINRRSFVKTAGIAGLAAATLPKFSFAAVKGDDRIKVGLIGCGGRGTGATINMICADQNVQLVAVADLFEDKIEPSLKRIQDNCKKKFPDKADAIIDPSKVKKFSGWNCVDELLKEDVDVVIEATPPCFRTPHYAKIVAAGKHAFLEKPCSIDITQARQMFELSAEADKKGLCVVCGTQRRYHQGYQEIIKRVQDGMIGEPLSAQAYWNSSGYVGDPQQNRDELGYDTMEYQIRNWFSFIWTSGDHIVEQHVHNLDVIMWALGDDRFPKEVRGWGGRSTDLPTPKYGDRFSHFTVDFDMGDGLRLFSFCQQDPKCAGEVGERLIGTKGIMNTALWGSKQTITDLKGNVLYAAPENVPECLEMEHKTLLDAIRAGKHINKLNMLINSTLLAIAGRMSAFSGKKFKYEWMLKRSQENLMPEKMEFCKHPTAGVPVPGKYKLV